MVSDVRQLQPAGFYSGAPIPKGLLGSTISEFDIRVYRDYSKFAGDGLEGHEVLQNAVLQRNGWGAFRGSNPAIALAQRPGLHGIVTDAQRAKGMFTNEYLNNVSRVGNIKDNLNILRSVGVPEATVQTMRREVITFARGLKQ